MEHARFVQDWRGNRIRVRVDANAASAFVSARLLLPFVGIAVIGLGIALVLWGWMWTGIAVGALGILGPRLVKRSAGHFVLGHLATDAELYRAALEAGVIEIVEDSRVG